MSPATREAVGEEARSWIGTRYLLNGTTKGAAIDCGRFPYCVYRAFDLIPVIDPLPRFVGDWWAHTLEERYLIFIQKYLPQTDNVRAFRDAKIATGNLVLSRTYKSPVYNHAGIVLNWPRTIHAVPDKVEEVDASAHPFWFGKELLVFDPWARKLPDPSVKEISAPHAW